MEDLYRVFILIALVSVYSTQLGRGVDILFVPLNDNDDETETSENVRE